MAAHGLTILRQFLVFAKSDRDLKTIYRHVMTGLQAKGACLSEGFDWDTWHVLEDMAYNQKDLAGFTKAVEAAIPAHMWMDAYPTLESLQMAHTAYVRPGKPHWKARQERFQKGSLVARKLIAPMYPLSRRAPTF